MLLHKKYHSYPQWLQHRNYDDELVSQLWLLHKNTKMVYVTFHCQSKLGIKPMNFRWTLMETQILDQGTVHGVENRYQHIVK